MAGPRVSGGSPSIGSPSASTIGGGRAAISFPSSVRSTSVGSTKSSFRVAPSAKEVRSSATNNLSSRWSEPNKSFADFARNLSNSSKPKVAERFGQVYRMGMFPEAKPKVGFLGPQTQKPFPIFGEGKTGGVKSSGEQKMTDLFGPRVDGPIPIKKDLTGSVRLATPDEMRQLSSTGGENKGQGTKPKNMTEIFGPKLDLRNTPRGTDRLRVGVYYTPDLANRVESVNRLIEKRPPLEVGKIKTPPNVELQTTGSERFTARNLVLKLNAGETSVRLLSIVRAGNSNSIRGEGLTVVKTSDAESSPINKRPTTKAILGERSRPQDATTNLVLNLPPDQRTVVIQSVNGEVVARSKDSLPISSQSLQDTKQEGAELVPISVRVGLERVTGTPNAKKTEQLNTQTEIQSLAQKVILGAELLPSIVAGTETTNRPQNEQQVLEMRTNARELILTVKTLEQMQSIGVDPDQLLKIATQTLQEKGIAQEENSQVIARQLLRLIAQVRGVPLPQFSQETTRTPVAEVDPNAQKARFEEVEQILTDLDEDDQGRVSGGEIVRRYRYTREKLSEIAADRETDGSIDEFLETVAKQGHFGSKGEAAQYLEDLMNELKPVRVRDMLTTTGVGQKEIWRVLQTDLYELVQKILR